MSDRIGRRVVLLCGLVATAVATASLGAADSLGWFLAGRALQGFVASSCPPVALSLVGEVLPPARRPLGVSLISFAFLAAAPVAQFVGVATAAGLESIVCGNTRQGKSGRLFSLQRK
ncbi:MFS transporter [Roseivivax sp. THAF30]|uniref:MFS transporter n=1 Tax=Roseivivax sp. THAF30 TaxID=2587852 RepID=UPI001562DFE2|nr:MFS transporter [Roseivivax sp. THAF30]